MDLCRDRVRQCGGRPKGEVSFGMPGSVSTVLSVPLTETVLVEQPQIKLRVIEAMSGFIRDWLEDQTIDLAFLYDVNELKHCEVSKLMSENLYFFAAPDNWPFSKPPETPVELSEVQQLDLILPSIQHGLRQTLERHARTLSKGLNVIIEMDSLAQIKELVVRGSGYTILAPAAANDRVHRGELLMSRIVEPVISRPVYLVRNQVKPMTDACGAVERTTLDVVEDLVRRKIWLVAEPDG
jgi:LysR family nitrogen assimilation transcriptional regulator